MNTANYRDYYRRELNNLGHNLEYAPTMQFNSDNGKTKYLTMNADSIKEVVNYALNNNIIDLNELEAFITTYRTINGK